MKNKLKLSTLAEQKKVEWWNWSKHGIDSKMITIPVEFFVIFF